MTGCRVVGGPVMRFFSSLTIQESACHPDALTSWLTNAIYSFEFGCSFSIVALRPGPSSPYGERPSCVIGEARSDHCLISKSMFGSFSFPFLLIEMFSKNNKRCLVYLTNPGEVWIDGDTHEPNKKKENRKTLSAPNGSCPSMCKLFCGELATNTTS
jgi:hypothetical protein